MTDDAFEAIENWADPGGTWEVRQFRIYRKGRELHLELLSRPLGAGETDYLAHAWVSDLPTEDQHAADPRYAVGNSADNAKDAIDGLHWWKFDALPE